jgi:hypothetical protein
MMTLDCTGIAPELLHATLEALAPLEVEHAGQTFPALVWQTERRKWCRETQSPAFES